MRLKKSVDDPAILRFQHSESGAEIVVGMMPVENEMLTADDVADSLIGPVRRAFPKLTEVRHEALPGPKNTAIFIHLHDPEAQALQERFIGIFTGDRFAYLISAKSPASASNVQADIEAVIRSFSPPSAPRIAALPRRVLDVPEPPEPPAQLRQMDLRKVPPAELWWTSRGMAAQGDPEAAIRLAYWAVARNFGRGRYDLARYHSGLGLVDEAFYWLQRAAAEEGVETADAEVDSDLRILRSDRRWSTIQPYLISAERYWRGSGTRKTLLVLPKGYAFGKPIPVLIALHGLGSDPSDFAGADMQQFADAQTMAVVSVSGTLPLGPHKFRWVESPTRDRERIEEALAEIGARVTTMPGRMILLGFSQGGIMAAEIAAREPHRYAGAIVMSPGGKSDLGLERVTNHLELSKRRFVVVAGAGEHPTTVKRAQQNTERLRALGADVFHKIYAEQQQHSVSPDFATVLPVWIKFILGDGPRPK
jgi:predicted esterase